MNELEEGLVFQPRFDANGLIAAIVVDAASKRPLMFAYMNEEALQRTLATGEVHFWSRSRGRLWRKGETSGNTLTLKAMYADCDQDALLIEAELNGEGVCHTGRETCFYRRVSLDGDGRAKLDFAP